MPADTLTVFNELRPLLFSIAYRMLGTVMDAEDMVQETFIRWQGCDQANVESPKGWLSTVVTRLCINYLKSARVQRETYVGPWLPEPLVARLGVDPRENAQLADSLSLAFLVLLESLTPTERAVFVLREVFNYEFADIAPIVEKTEANCRQILARARKSVEERRPRFDASPEEAEHLIRQFDEAVRTGDLEGLLKLLAKDVVLVTDGGGKALAVLRPLLGADHVARLFIGIAKKFGGKTQVVRHAMVNGLPGYVAFEGERPVRVLVFGIRNGLIQSLFGMTNPDKLRHLARSGQR
ncbi:MAG: polymerase, sigma-24 subunit, subfamily [Pedosphaera sp.]|nr:polymerase, sigma-24 subunit, subfamily [Pedosphaera sp.]